MLYSITSQITETDTAPVINIDTDLKLINKPLSTIIKKQIHGPPSGKEMYFDQIHLSPLKLKQSCNRSGPAALNFRPVRSGQSPAGPEAFPDR
ncbi:unnamed protein product [Didymodactylos carnosus]|uniref:Uncharacterized protein n=1 Tax=Didymodactylos carnosus TaxID=1234261 RepID=A0A8S2F290_9BILA|nr:unnamed protein product [Didymodactylos carnosus]CAF4184368.1 unnamed protein product [Didymodactylos carnosus]